MSESLMLSGRDSDCGKHISNQLYLHASAQLRAFGCLLYLSPGASTVARPLALKAQENSEPSDICSQYFQEAADASLSLAGIARLRARRPAGSATRSVLRNPRS